MYLRKFFSKLKDFGPAFFIIGYVIGTGSVTSLIIAGSKYGLTISWALILSCLFTFFLIVSISKLTIVSGKSLIYNFRLYFGKPLTIFVMIGLLFSILSSVIGVMGVIANVMSEWINSFLSEDHKWIKLFSSIVFILILYLLFLTGRYRIFIGGMTALVAIMSISFLLTCIIIFFDPEISIITMMSKEVSSDNPSLIIAGLVGTTMASVVLVSRSMLVQEEKWQISDLKKENRDASFSMLVTLLVSIAIMIFRLKILLI